MPEPQVSVTKFRWPPFRGNGERPVEEKQEVPIPHPAPWFLQTAWGWQTPTGKMDVREVGDGSRNSAVVACLKVLATSFSEAPAKVFTLTEEGEEENPVHDMTQLLRRPNPFMIGEMLWSYVIVATHVKGDAYLLKRRNGIGRVVERWPLMPALVEPKGSQDKTVFIERYDYNVDGRLITTGNSIMHRVIEEWYT